MKRTLSVLALLTFSSRAWADEPVTTPVENVVPPKAEISNTHEMVTDPATEDLPLRLRDLLRLEAGRARTGRYFSGAFGVIGGAGVTILGGLSLANADPADTFRKDYSYLIMATGAIGVVTSLFGLFGQTPLERLYESYAPFAVDPKYPAEQRLREGENALRQMAATDASSRRVNGITGIVVGALLGGVAIWVSTTPLLEKSNQLVLGGLTGVSSLLAIGSSIGELWFQRGPAEVALEHWEAARGVRHEARIAPLLAPVAGGVVSGMMVSF